MKAQLFFILLVLFTNAVCFAQPKFSIVLKVEDSSAYTIYHNEPLILSTSLTNDSLQQNLEWNQEADAGLKEVAADYKAGKISKEEFDKETQLIKKGKKQIKGYTIGTYRLPWFKQLQFRVLSTNGQKPITWPILLLGDPLTDSIAHLDENGYYMVRHHLSPAQVTKQKPGTYTIQALLAGVWSNAVTVKIRQENIPAHVLNSKQMLLRLGNYYLDNKEADKSLLYTSALLKKDPLNISGLTLCGEGLILKRKYKLALACFEKALQQHKKKYPNIQEPPEYLLGTIAWLKEKK